MGKEIEKRTRNRLNPCHRWREEETEEFISRLLSAIRKDPISFERPTCQRFYDGLKKHSRYIREIQWKVLKSKLRSLKSGYTAAVQWQSQTGLSLLAKGDTETVQETIKKMSPHFESLDEIFQHVASLSLVVNESINSDDQMQFEDVKINFEDDHEDSNTSTDTDVLGGHDLPTMDIKQNSTPALKVMDTKFIKRLATVKPQKPVIEFSSSSSMLMTLQEKMLDLERKKLEWQIEIDKKNIEVRKLELQLDYDLKKLECEKNERLESEKLKLQNVTDERMRKYELELKFQKR